MTTAIVKPLPAGRPILIRLPSFKSEISISSEWVVMRNETVASAQALATVGNPLEFQEAGALLQRITRVSNTLEEMRKDLGKPFRNADKIIKSASDKAREPLEAEKTRIKNLIETYAAAERRRLAAETQQREEEQQRQIEAQLSQQQAGEEAGLEPPVVIECTTPAAPANMMPRSDAVRIGEAVEFELVNEDAVPRAFLIFDPRKAQQYCRENKDEIKDRVGNGEAERIVPGLRFRVRTTVAGR